MPFLIDILKAEMCLLIMFTQSASFAGSLMTSVDTVANDRKEKNYFKCWPEFSHDAVLFLLTISVNTWTKMTGWGKDGTRGMSLWQRTLPLYFEQQWANSSLTSAALQICRHMKAWRNIRWCGFSCDSAIFDGSENEKWKWFTIEIIVIFHCCRLHVGFVQAKREKLQKS